MGPVPRRIRTCPRQRALDEPRLVDLRSMRRTLRIATGFTTALAWPTPERVVLLERGARRWRLALIDRTVGRVLSRRGLGTRGDVASAALTHDGLAVLMMPGNRIGVPWLLVLDAGGRARRVALTRLEAGRAKRQTGERFRIWYRMPGLAVDAERGRAYVVTAGTRVVVVDLATLAVSYRQVRALAARPVASVGTRTTTSVRSGGDVLATGTVRQAHSLGNGAIAIAGWNDLIVRGRAGRPEARDEPAGLRLVDTRTWTARRLTGDARWFHATADSVVARVPLGPRPGAALVGFTHEGDERFRIELDRLWFGIQSAGAYAYLGLDAEYRPHAVAVVDARTGELVGTPEAPGWVLLLTPSQPQLCSCYTGTTVG